MKLSKNVSQQETIETTEVNESIGYSFIQKYQDNLAYEYYYKALEIYNKYLLMDVQNIKMKTENILSTLHRIREESFLLIEKLKITLLKLKTDKSDKDKCLKYLIAVKYYKKITKVQISINPNDKIILTKLYILIIHCYARTEQNDIIVEQINEALNNDIDVTLFENIDTSYLFKIIVKDYFKKYDYQLATEYFIKTLTLKENAISDNEFEISYLYFQTGECFRKLKNYSLVIEYFKKALKVYETVIPNNKTIYYLLHTGVGDCYSTIKDYYMTIKHYTQGFIIQIKIIPYNRNDIINL
ncbi:unnamed protein product [Didymodactylos carnosus]|uniref:Tetratricopeptide repeat protein n=1 Tax=Didymodactylos carnosus TaxID=1234261 RepID=A0A815BMS7_9BILA|nr:unnamed protein product [Didymodactylos carnosus]CAF1272480.1 unnamed protein product [Didymodactylos carnosus]CAF3980498.1 unnamed protein product [Didymodactylos carnosus]CAF4061788.1 unnamed protein product [Didymodactylos carnosus]